MKRIHRSLYVLILCLAFSCSDDHDRVITLSGDSLPLAVGNYWEFYGINGTLSDDVIEHREVMSKATINGHEYYLVASTHQYGDDPFVDSLYYRVESNGYVYTYRKGYKEEAQDFRLEAKDGDTWTYTFANQETRITVSDGSVELKSKTIENCKNYFRDTIQSADEEYTITLAPGIGFVKEFSNAWGGGQVLKSARIDGVVKTF